MASIDTSSDGGGGKKKVRSKKMDTRIDFTPMVDLGFLLITFFMLTTTLSKPNVMPMVMPEKKDVDLEDQDPVKESKVLTLLLGKDDVVYYYEGITDPVLDSTDYSAEGLRDLLLRKRDKVRQEFPDIERTDTLSNGELKIQKIPQVTVILKPMDESRYKNLVDAFDELAITGVKLKVMLDISEQELEFIKNPAGGLKFSAEEQSAATTK